MEDIKILYETAKTSGLEDDVINYMTELDWVFESNPLEYLSNAEYIISSEYGAKQFIEFIETYGLAIPAYDYIVECTEKIIQQGKIYNKNTNAQQELLSYLENYKKRYDNCFTMFEYYANSDPDVMEQYFNEASKGNLQVAHRLAVIRDKSDPRDGHRVHIIYDLNGDWELVQNNTKSDQYGLGKRKVFKGPKGEEGRRQIRKLGNTDFCSKGHMVKAVKDLDDNNKIIRDKIITVGPFGYNNNTYKIQMGTIDKNALFKSTFWSREGTTSSISGMEGHTIRGMKAKRFYDHGSIYNKAKIRKRAEKEEKYNKRLTEEYKEKRKKDIEKFYSTNINLLISERDKMHKIVSKMMKGKNTHTFNNIMKMMKKDPKTKKEKKFIETEDKKLNGSMDKILHKKIEKGKDVDDFKCYIPDFSSYKWKTFSGAYDAYISMVAAVNVAESFYKSRDDLKPITTNIDLYNRIKEFEKRWTPANRMTGSDLDDQLEKEKSIEESFTYEELMPEYILYQESFIDEMSFGHYLIEKSNGKLQVAHRLAIITDKGPREGHKIHIIYDLNGDWELVQNNTTGDGIGTRVAKGGAIDDKERIRLRKEGNTDFQSKGHMVKVIRDLDDNNAIIRDPIHCKGPYGGKNNYGAKPILIQMGKIDNNPTFKSTVWTRGEINKITGLEGHRIRGMKAMRMMDYGSVSTKESIEEDGNAKSEIRKLLEERKKLSNEQMKKLESKIKKMIKDSKKKKKKVKNGPNEEEKKFIQDSCSNFMREWAVMVKNPRALIDKDTGKVKLNDFPDFVNYKWKTLGGIMAAYESLAKIKEYNSMTKKVFKHSKKKSRKESEKLQEFNKRWTPANRLKKDEFEKQLKDEKKQAKKEKKMNESAIDYIEDYYSFYEGIQQSKNLTEMIETYGICAIPDMLITATNINEAAIDVTYAYLSGYAEGDRMLNQFLYETAEEIVHTETPYMENIEENSLQNIVDECKYRNQSIFREATIMGDDNVMMEYSDEELKAIQDLIAIREYQMIDMKEPYKTQCFNEILSLYEEFDGLLSNEEDDIESYMEETNPGYESATQVAKKLTNLSKRIASSVKTELSNAKIVNGRMPFKVGCTFGTKIGPCKGTVSKILKDNMDDNSKEWINNVFLFITLDIDAHKSEQNIEPSKVRPIIMKAIRYLIDNKTLKSVKNLSFNDSDKYFCWLAFRVSKKFAISDTDTSIVESVDRMLEDVADNVLPMVALPDDQILEARWMYNTMNKKTGEIPHYLGNNHDLEFGEDETYRRKKFPEDLDSDSDSEYSDFKSAPVGDAEEDEFEDDSSDDTPSSSPSGATTNYYYYTYNNSLNKNSHSFNKQHREDHSRRDDHSTHYRSDDHSVNLNNTDNHSSATIDTHPKIGREDDIDGGRPKEKDYTDPDDEYHHMGESKEENEDTPTSNKDEPLEPILGIAVSYTRSKKRNDGTDKDEVELDDTHFSKEIAQSTLGDNFSHMLVSFDTDLKEMYSFRDTGIVKEGINNRSWMDTKSIYICVMFVKKSDKDRMKKYVNQLMRHKGETEYAYQNLVQAYVGKPIKNDKRYVCSTFTAYILQCSNPKNLHRDYSRQRPEDLTILPRSFYVANVKDKKDFLEKKEEIKKKIDTIYDEHQNEIKDYNNHLPKILLVNKVKELKTIDKIMDWAISKIV